MTDVPSLLTAKEAAKALAICRRTLWSIFLAPSPPFPAMVRSTPTTTTSPSWAIRVGRPSRSVVTEHGTTTSRRGRTPPASKSPTGHSI